MTTCSHFVGAQNIRRLDAPAGAFVELSTGERRTLADLLAKHAWALKDSEASGAPGAWCCVPVWNGRSRAEMWANVVGFAVAANSAVALSTDPNCATRLCNQDQLPVTVPAFVNLCPQTLPCGSGSAQGMNGPIHEGGNSSSSASTSALPRPPPPSPPPPPPPSPQPDAVSSNAGSSSNDIKVGAANGPPPPSPSVAGRLDVVVLPAQVVARSSGGGSRRGAPSIISSALLLSAVASVPLLLI